MFREGGVACESAFTCLSTFVHVCLAMSVWGVTVYIFRYVVLFTYVGMPVSVCVCCSLSSCVCRCMSTLWDGLSACLCGWRERVRASSYPLPTLAVLTSLPVYLIVPPSPLPHLSPSFPANTRTPLPGGIKRVAEIVLEGKIKKQVQDCKRAMEHQITPYPSYTTHPNPLFLTRHILSSTGTVRGDDACRILHLLRRGFPRAHSNVLTTAPTRSLRRQV